MFVVQEISNYSRFLPSKMRRISLCKRGAIFKLIPGYTTTCLHWKQIRVQGVKLVYPRR